MKIGAIVEAFGLDLESSIKSAAALGIEGVQVHAVRGELAYDTITVDKKRWALDLVKSNGLVFSALCGDFGYGFGRGEAEDAQLADRLKRVLEMAKELECSVVTAHIGKIPDAECRLKEQMRRYCGELARFADSMGSAFAIETGPEMAWVLGEFIDSLGAGGVKVNFDPANLVMVAGDRPETAVKTLGKYIVHTHAKDGIKLGACGTAEIDIDSFSDASDRAWLNMPDRKYFERPLGEGGVNYDLYLSALKDTGFDGFLTIERRVGENPMADISHAAEFLRKKKLELGI